MNKDLQLALKINIDKKEGETNLTAFNRAFEAAMSDIGKNAKDIDAFKTLKKQLQEGTVKVEELDAETQQLYKTYEDGATLAADRDILGLKAHLDIQNEIKATRQAYDRLKASGNLTQTELAQAALKTEERIRELKHETNGWTDALHDARGSLTALAGSTAGLALMAGEAIEFESAMADVKKVVDGTEEQFDALTGRIKEMSAELPISADGLAQIAAAGGQLGVPIDKLDQFVALAAKMSVAFDLSVEQAGDAVAKLSNIFNLPIDNVEALGDAINTLGNTTAAREADILNVLTRIGGTASQFKLSAEQSAALAATMIEMGATSEVAGTGINALLSKLQTANVQSKDFQSALNGIGLSAEQLAADIREDPQQALTEFLRLLSKLDDQARAETLSRLFGQEYQDDIARLLNGLDKYDASLTRISASANTAGAMQAEFAARMETTEAQIELMKNGLQEVAINLGTIFLPVIRQGAVILGDLSNAIAEFVEANPEISAIATTLGAVTFSASTLRLMFLSLNVAGTKMFGDLNKNSVLTKTSIFDLTKQVGFLGAAIRSIAGVWGAFEIGYTIGETLREKFAFVEKAGIQLAGTLTMMFEYIRAAWEVTKAVFTDDTIEAAMDRHKERLAEMQQIYGEMLAEVDLRRMQEQHTSTAQSVTEQADATQTLTQQQQSLSLSLSNTSALLEQHTDALKNATKSYASLSASGGDARESLEQISQQINAMANDANISANEIEQALSDAFSDLTGSELLQLKKQLKDTFESGSRAAKALSNVVDNKVSDALANLGLSFSELETGIDATAQQALDSFATVVAVIKETGTEADIAAQKIAEAYATAHQQIGDDEKAVAQLNETLQQAGEEGLISGEKVGNAMAEAAEKTSSAMEKTADATEQSSNRIGRSAGNIKANMNDVKDAADETTNSVEQSAAGVQALAEYISSFYQNTVDELQSLSQQTANLFQAKMGMETSAVLTEVEALEAALQAAESAAIEAQTSFANIGVDTTGLNSYINKVNIASNQASAAFYRQKLAYQDLMAEINNGDLSGNALVQAAERAVDRFDLLDSQDLSNLESAISSARYEMEALNDSAANTLSSLQNELDRLKGDYDAVEQRQYEQQKAELEALIEDARAAGNSDAIDQYRESLKVLEQIRKEQIAQAKAEAEAEAASASESSSNTSSSSSSDSAATSSSSSNTDSRSLDLKLPSGTTATVNGSSEDVDALLDFLTQAQLSTVG